LREIQLVTLNNDTDMMKYILGHLLDYNNNSLITAVAHGRVEVIKYLIDRSWRNPAIDKHLFEIAAATSQLDVVKFSSKSTRVEPRIFLFPSHMPVRMIPLISLPIQQYDIILAASCGNMAMISYIVNNLSNINYISEALITACGGGHLEAVKRLVELNGDPTVHDNRPIKRAGEWSHLNMVKYLITVNTDIHAENDILL
jgi:ankyrin repeat protein